MKNLVIFGGSRELPEEYKASFDSFLDELFTRISREINRIIYGGGKYGVMLQIFEKSREHQIEIIGYSLEKYRNKDTEAGTLFFPDDEERIKGFYKDGDVFLACAGGFGTFKEVLQINELIKKSGSSKKINIPRSFLSFYNLLDNLGNENMIAHEDMSNFVKVNQVSDFRL